MTHGQEHWGRKGRTLKIQFSSREPPRTRPASHDTANVCNACYDNLNRLPRVFQRWPTGAVTLKQV